MKRVRNRLIFEPQERDRFFHALRLFLALKRYEKEVIDYQVEHEKDHLAAISDLGYEDKIRGYFIGRDEAGISFNPNGIPKRLKAIICLAPSTPSLDDIALIVGFRDMFRFGSGKINLEYLRAKYTPD